MYPYVHPSNRPSVYTSVCLSNCMSVHPSTHLTVCQSVCMSSQLCLSTHLIICQLVCLSACLFVCPYVHPIIDLSIQNLNFWLTVCLSIHISVFLSVQFFYLHIYPPNCPFVLSTVCPTICLYASHFVHLPIYMYTSSCLSLLHPHVINQTICLSVCLPIIHLFNCVSFNQFIFLSTQLSFCLNQFLSVCLSVQMYNCLFVN